MRVAMRAMRPNCDRIGRCATRPRRPSAANPTPHVAQAPDPDFRQPQRAAAQAVPQDGARDQRARAAVRAADRRRAARPRPPSSSSASPTARRSTTLLPEAFAVVREAAQARAQMRHFDVQLIGGMVLHHGKIAEMRTGEGKTLVATLPVYLNALAGKGVHVVTVNDYLAQRDAEWMGTLYRFLGLTRRRQPAADGARRQAGRLRRRHHLRHQQRVRLRLPARQHGVATSSDRVQRGLHYAIVDEVDSILIDEARTPLIISGQAEDRTELYQRMNEVRAAAHAAEGGEEATSRGGDFSVDEKAHQVLLTEEGHEHAEQLLREAGPAARGREPVRPGQHRADASPVRGAARARTCTTATSTTSCRTARSIIVDEFTGRLMPGRRWSDGLHQAVEAKEGVPIQSENQTLASITFQNYFRMYDKLAGMTGTADTEAYEFQEIYGLETVVIPTQQADDPQGPARPRLPDREREVRRGHRGHPGLPRARPAGAGRHDLDRELRAARPSCSTKASCRTRCSTPSSTSARREIVAQAGRPKMITIATNMAGRGTDIVLGGNVEKQIRDASRPTRRSTPRTKAARDRRSCATSGRRCTTQVVEAGRPAHHRHRAPRVAAHRQPAARPLRPPGRPGLARASTCRSKTRCCASSPATACSAIMERLKMPEGEAIERRHGHALDRERAAQGRGAQLRHPQAPARVRRRRQRPAQGDLPAAQRDPRGADVSSADRQPARRAR